MWFVLVVFGAYRITRLITTDDIAQPVRNLWYRWFPQDTKPGSLIACPYCAGMYVSAAFALGLALAFSQFRHCDTVWMVWPAIAGAQSLLNAVDERLDR